MADELARWGALLAPSAIPCSLFPLISRIHSCLLSDWRRTVSSKFFDKQVPSISTVELVLPRHAHCVLSRLRCNGHSLLLGSYLSRIRRIENPSCSPVDTSHLIRHCPATDSFPRSLFGNSGKTLESCSASEDPWSLAMPPSLGRGRVTNNNNKSHYNQALLCAHCRITIRQVTKNRNQFYVTSGLMLRTTNAFIMEMNYANDNSISEAAELNIPTLVLRTSSSRKLLAA